MAELPTGTVTFLFTDVEGSTRLWEEHADAMQGALGRHDEIVADAVAGNAGLVLSRMGDGIAAVFASAPDALHAMLDAQSELVAEGWGETGPLRVRMGAHSDEGRLRAPGEYMNRPLNRCARLMAVAHGGQMLVSEATVAVTRDGLPPRAALVDLGDHRLRDLAEPIRVFQLVHPDLPAEFPPLRSLDARPGNLSRQVTTFVGRETEIATLTDLVCHSPLVTLTGVGGVGKTRLALQVAAEAVVHFRDGAWLCALAPLADPDAVWETLAASLRVQPSPGRALDELVLEFLTAKRLLLVLDNCEHLLGAVARVVDAIAQRCPQVAVLATSREGLALAGERIVAVATLAVPADDSDFETLLAADAVQLFSDRAAAANNDFRVTERNASAVGVLCRRLDGIPLAIELAAARVRSLSPDDLVARLDQRFKLLTKGSRAALERHQTLRSTIDWSYALLEPTERQALDRLSVFAGGCDLTAAEAVLEDDALDRFDVVDGLSQLVDKSLVVADSGDDGSGVRYRLLESIRQYTQERLEAGGDTERVRRRHADHYVAVAETAGPHLRSRDQLAWATAVLRDTDNLRAALDWAVETPSPEHALRLVAPLTVTGMAIGEVAIDWAETATDIPGVDMQPLFPVVAAFAAFGATMELDFARAEARIAAAERALGPLDAPPPSVLRARAVLAFFQGDVGSARHHAQAWVDFGRTASDSYELAHGLIMLGTTLMSAGPTGAVATGRAGGGREERDAAIELLEEAVRVARDGGILSALAIGLFVLFSLVMNEDLDRAIVLVDEAIDVGTQINDRITLSTSTSAKGFIAARRGEWRTALRAAADSAEQILHIGNVVNIAGSLDLAGEAFAALGHVEPAAVMFGKADEMFPDRRPPDWVEEMLASARTAILDALGDQQAAMLAARGAALDFRDAVEYLRVQADLVLDD